VSGRKKIAEDCINYTEFIYYVINWLMEVKEEFVSVSAKRDWLVSFTWSDLEICRHLLKPLTDVTNELEGNKYSTLSAANPFIICIKECLLDISGTINQSQSS
jgi:hypothetical protein